MSAAQNAALNPARIDTPTATGAATGAERMLVQATERLGRAAPGWVALALHLSGLLPPAPRPHHRRIARAVLQDTAQRQDGQMFTLRNGDMVLICRAHAAPTPQPRVIEAPGRADAGQGPNYPAWSPPAWIAPVRNTRPPSGHGSGAGLLPDTLSRLFRADVPDPSRLLSVWDLAKTTGALLRYARDRLAETTQRAAREEEPADTPGSVDAVAAVIGNSRIADLLHRQTAVILTPGGGADPMRPLFREIAFSLPAVQARVAAAGAPTDPFLFRHLATRLDARMLEVLLLATGQDGPLHLAGFADSRPSLHLNMTLDGILSPVFARFVAACQTSSAGVGIEVALMEAAADPAGYARARALLADSGLSLVLDGITHLALQMTEPAALGADMYKLEWSPRLAEMAGDELAPALRRLDPRRVVLYRAETESAITWALAQGIRRVQGRHIDAMLGAGRIVGCAQAPACTLRECIERAAALSPPGRRGCRNEALLDGGTGAALAGTAA